MGSVYAVTNVMDSANYQFINCYQGNGNRGFCGWGVRNRGGDLALNKTVLCQNWAANPGATISYIRFRTGAVTGAGTITFTWWQKAAGVATFTRKGTITLDGSEFDAGWVADTVYVYALPTPVQFSSTSGSTCLMSVYTPVGSLVQLDYTAATGSADARIYTGDASANASFDWDTGLGVTDVAYAIAAEAFDEPDLWDTIDNGGSLIEESANWEAPAFCTSPGAGWDNLGNLYDNNPATISVSVGGNGAEVLLDLGAGQIATEPWAQGKSFPDYTETGVRAVYLIDIEGEVKIGGTIALAYSSTDTDTAPVAGYENIYWNDTVAVFSDTITVPVIARWIRITEAGASAVDEIGEITINQIKYGVTDGKFYVEAEDASHYVWVDNYPKSDKAYVFSIENVCGAESRTSDPITNRKYKD